MQKRISHNGVLPGLPGSVHSMPVQATPPTEHPVVSEPQITPDWAIPTEPITKIGWDEHSTSVRNPIMFINGLPVDIAKTAVEAWDSTDPLSRFAGMSAALVASVLRGTTAGASLGETAILLSLVGLITEASEGNFSNAIWKACKDKATGPKRKSSFDRQEAEAMIILLCQHRQTMDGLTDKAYEKACSRVAFDLDDRLKRDHGYVLDQWLLPYQTERSGDPESDRRQRKDASIWEDERRHPMAGRIKRWSAHDKSKLPLVKRMWDVLTDSGSEHAYRIMLIQTVRKIVVSASDGDADDNPQDLRGGTPKTNIGC